MKILLISPIPPPVGGIATWTEQYLKWLTQKQFNVYHVNTSKSEGNLESNRKKSNQFIRTRKIINNLRMKIKKINPDIIHLNTSCAKFGLMRDYLCAKMAKKSKTKLIVQYHCNIIDQVRKNPISKYFLKKISNIADKNIVLNKTSQDYLFNNTHNYSEVIPNFISESFLIKESKIINDNIYIISFVGHIRISKGILEIIEVARKKSDIIFKLVGPIDEEIKNISIPLNIHLMGAMSTKEIKEILKTTDVFLFPTHTEGFSIALLEAMSCGLPIVTTPVGANIDMIESNGGIIVKTNDIEGILNAIDKMKDPNIRKDMSVWNVNKVKNEYTTEVVSNKLTEAYLY